MHKTTAIKLSFLIVLLSVFFNAAFTQVPVTKSENKVVLDGKVFYVHVVKASQTLYSICKAYDITESAVIAENPGVDKSLTIGQVVKIPVNSNIKQQNTLIASPAVITPPDSVDGYHRVKQGETMYSIARTYMVSINDLDAANPQVVNHQISIGQLIKIPTKEKPVEIAEGEYTLHKVRRKETVFGIAKMYNISEEILKKYNPELNENFPKPGQNLKIPVTINIAFTEVPVIETEDSIAGFIVQKYDTTKIASNYSYYFDSIPDRSGKTINVSYLIPFNYRPPEEIAPVELQGRTKDDIQNLDHEVNPNDQMLSSRNFLEFMEGSLLAIDSLKNEGISVNVSFFDTRKSPERTREILNSPGFENTDLIIGPFYSYNVEIVSEYSRLHQIPMVSPFSGEIGPVMNNPLFFQLNPGYQSEYDRMAEYITHFKNKKIVFIHGVDSLELIKFNYLKQNLMSRCAALSPSDTLAYAEIAFDRFAKGNLAHELQKVLSKDSSNFVVIPETDEAFVSTVVTQLYFQVKNYDITVMGTPHWSTFQNIDFNYYHKLSLTYFTPYYFSYESPKIKHFLKDYRKSYYSEPVTLSKKGGSYAFLGYDLSYYFLKIMDSYGKRFIMHLDEQHGAELMNSFRFVPVGGSGGFENRSMMLVKFDENMDIHAKPYEIALPQDMHENSIPLK